MRRSSVRDSAAERRRKPHSALDAAHFEMRTAVDLHGTLTRSPLSFNVKCAFRANHESAAMLLEDLSSDDLPRAGIVDIIVRDTPKAFWEDLRARSHQTYLDVFKQIENDPNVLAEQRIDSLYQQRHFRMENLLKTLADSHGLATSATLLVENNRRYVYVTKGAVGLTQAYVPSIGEMPKPARFRQRHSAMNAIAQAPGLDFGLDAPELLELKAFYGLIAHNPGGKRFTEFEQALGMIQLCVPAAGFKAWSAQITLQEIISAYPAARPEAKPERGPTWKAPADDKKEQG